jgi:hypothetical protein
VHGGHGPIKNAHSSAADRSGNTCLQACWREAVDGLLAVELTIGLPSELSLTGGGRDLDNYLFPLAQRLGPTRIAAMFGQKVHGPSFLAVGRAQPDHSASPPHFSAQVAGSYVRKEWKITLREQLLQIQHAVPAAGPIGMTISIITGPGRNWANLWKPLIDAFGPVLGENPEQSFHPNDDRITSLGGLCETLLEEVKPDCSAE